MAHRPATYPARFLKDEDGAIAMTFALVSTAFMLIIGCAVDIGKAIHANQKIGTAIDGASIAAAKALKDGSSPLTDIETLARTYFDQNIKGSGDYAKVNKFDVTVDEVKHEVTVSVEAAMPTAFARVAGIQQINIPKSATAVFAIRDIEVGLALDVTGSMGSSPKGGGPRKIDTLKSSVEKFANLMLPDNPPAGQKVRIGLAPYSASINLGPSIAKTVSNSRSKDGCVTERTTGDKYTDASISAGGYYKVAADGIKDTDPTEGNVGNNAYACPPAVLMPLTDKRNDIISTVKSYKEAGWTAGHFGAQWAWNLVSEDWGDVFSGASKPDSYAKVAEQKLTKAVILMTDGVFNTAYHNGDSATQALELCKNMKDKGVVVFSIAFDAPAAAKKTLEACATTGSDYYADASNAADLDAAFAAFAAKIKALRLAR